MTDTAPPWYYDRALVNPLHGWYHLNRAKAVCRELPKRPRLLVDVGCDGGTLTEIIAECSEAERVIGVDVKESSVRYARHVRRRGEFYVADAHRLPLRDSVADVVTMLEVLEHLSNPGEALREAHRVLKPGGLLVVLVPNARSALFNAAWWLWTHSFGRAWRDAHHHDFSEEALVKAVGGAGFKVRRIARVNLGMLILLTATKR
ncbi:MAG: class I SAM-dependent methyltransferase [Thermofilaceae archaeon]